LYCYKLYGLTVSSQLRIPDAGGSALPCGETTDVTLTLDIVPEFRADEKLEKLTDSWYYSAPDPQLFYMHCDGYDFEISDGRRITVDAHDQDIESSGLVTYILGSAFGVIGMQRGLIPIHGAAISVGDTSVIITGHSGSGKSAILSELLKAGYRYLADDVCMVSIENGSPCVFPSYPQRKITAITAEDTGEDISGITPQNEDGREKYIVRKDSEWLDKTLLLSHIVEIVPMVRENQPYFTPEIKRITGHASLRMVLRNQYRHRFAASIGTSPERMKRLLMITSSIKTCQVVRPAGGFPLKQTARMIIDKCFSAYE